MSLLVMGPCTVQHANFAACEVVVYLRVVCILSTDSNMTTHYRAAIMLKTLETSKAQDFSPMSASQSVCFRDFNRHAEVLPSQNVVSYGKRGFCK